MRKLEVGGNVGGVIDKRRKLVQLGFAAAIFLIPRLATAETWNTGGTSGAYFMYPSAATTKIGIGSNVAPSFQFQLFSNATEANLGIQSYGNRSALYFLKTNGTNSAPTTVGTSDQVGILEARGYSGTGFQAMSAIDFRVDGSFTSGQRPPSMIEFYTNKANAGQMMNMVIKNDGKVGIGTSAPDALLSLKSALTTTDYLLTIQNSNSKDVILAGKSGQDGVFYVNDLNGTSKVQIYSNGDSWFNGGRVGIGTSAPNGMLTVKSQVITTDMPLTVQNSNSKDVIQAGKSGQDGVFYVNDLNGNAKVQVYSNGASWFNGGSVGIGTSTPSEKLEVAGNAKIGGSILLDGEAQSLGSNYTLGFNDYFRIFMDGQTTDNGILHIRTGDNSNEAIYFEQGTSPDPTVSANVRMAIDGNGRVGIGTTSATGLLDIAGSTIVKNRNPVTYSTFRVQGPGFDNGLEMDFFGGSSYNNSGGSYGAGYGGGALVNVNNAPLVLGTSNVSRIHIAGNGDVGIGTVPAAKLDVAGNANISGSLTVASINTKVWSVAPDYVFEKGYGLAPLDHVEKYVEEHKHLPDIPSAREIKNNGLDLADMNMKLLRKVEELTLYAIEQEKKDHQRDAEMVELKRTIAALKVGRK